MINNGLLTLAKVLKIQPKIMYIILSLLAVILVALGLGLGIKREGLEPTTRTQLLDF